MTARTTGGSRMLQVESDGVDAPEAETAGAVESTWWLRRLVGYLAPHRRKLIVAFTAALIVMAATAILPLVIRATVDRAIVDKADSLSAWLTVLVGVGLVRTLFAGIRRYNASLIGYEVEFDFRRQIF